MSRRTVHPQNAGTRPRIRPAKHSALICVGHGAYGYGATPAEAYEQWEASRSYILHTPHRNVFTTTHIERLLKAAA